MLEQIDRRIPSLAVFFAGAFVVAVTLIFLKGLQDPDYFWHLRTGELILDHGLPRTDPFSFTYGGPWTLHEWLGEVTIAALDRAIGSAASLAVFAILAMAAFALLAAVLRRLGSHPRSIVAATVACAAVAIPYATVRPQIVSWLFMAALLGLLLVVRSGRQRLLVLLPVLFVVWANFHGLYVIGLGVLGLFAAATLLGRTPMQPHSGLVLAALAACVLAAALTPAGLEGLAYPLRYVDSGDWGLANIPEWQSPNFHDAVQLPLLVLIAVVALVPRPRGHEWLQVATVLALVGALLANRNAPVAAVVAFPYLALAFDARSPAPRVVPPGARLVQIGAVAAITVACLVALPGTAGWQGVTLGRYPARAVAALSTISPDARIVSEYGWGGYVASELFDMGARVFVDGRNDMYPESILHDYTTIRTAGEGWMSIVSRWDVVALLFAPDAPIVRGIAQSAGWCEVLSDDRQVLLMRTCPPAR